MERAEVLDVVRAKAVELLEVEPDDVQESKSFKADLDVDSLDLVEYTMALEDELGVSLPEDELTDLASIGDLVSLLCTKLAA